MKPWYEIVTPYSVIQLGHLEESLFIADLGDIIQESAPSEYLDPHKFFQQTYLTRGITSLLNSVRSKLCNQEGSGIIKLQTPFGGGKTHTLIAIYHYATSGSEVGKYLSIDPLFLKTKVVSIVGTQLNPLEGRKENNIIVHTLWGEIAYQIGGLVGYKEFEANDINRISPGKEKLQRFLAKYEPVLFLLDEMVEYVTKARGVPVNESNLGTQTLSFFHELTEAISSLTRSLLVITLPVHKYEDFSEGGSDTLQRMNHILGRVETIETPIDRQELYRLVTKRLIETVILQDRDEVVFNYMKVYQKRRNELPDKVQEPVFIRRMKDAYPFHPELIDLLYDNWSPFPSFQGIRAILRILAHTLSDLWSKKGDIDLILPADINLQQVSLRKDFLQHLNPQIELIFNTDVSEKNSNVSLLDKKHLNWNRLASHLSQTIFLSTFTYNEISKGITNAELKLRLIRLNFPPSLISEVLLQVQKSLYFLHLEDGRYYFSLVPNLNRKIEDLKKLHQVEFDIKMQEEIKKHVGEEISSIIWPTSSNEIPDDRQLKIVIVRPSTSEKVLLNWLDQKGDTFRQNKNTIIYALAKESFLSDLEDLILTKLALIELVNAKKHQNFFSEVKQRLEKTSASLTYCLRKTYSILFCGDRFITLGLPQLEYESLTKWYHRELMARDMIVSKLHYRKLVELFISSPSISTKQVLEQFYINPNFFKIESSAVIRQAICRGVEEGAFGFANLSNNEINIASFFISAKLAQTQISFTSGEVLIDKNIAEIIAKRIAENPEIKKVVIPDKIGKSITSDLLFETPSKLKPQEFSSLVLNIQDLNSKSLPALYRGVLKPLEKRNAEIFLELRMEIKCEQKISEILIETGLSETITQLGARITQIKKAN
ncbi:MAG: ATP-binding protein [Candidatus Heimdallarchaeota archaeon]|nr:MAG: ATP-binding protein [Candidatus Heimdallarchaeota archaeon]